MTSNTTDSSFALVPEEAARQEIENLRKENSELKAMIEAYKQLPATLENKLREKESELARSEADFRNAVNERNDYQARFIDAAEVCRDLFIDLAGAKFEFEEDQLDDLADKVNGLSFPQETIKVVNLQNTLGKLEDVLEDVVTDKDERLCILGLLLDAIDLGITVTSMNAAAS